MKIKTIGVVGLGYVGLPLALQAESKDLTVIGIDLDNHKLKMLESRVPIIDDVISKERLSKTSVNFTNNFKKLKDVQVAVICVPTPVDNNKMPDISLVKNASVEAAKNMPNGSLLIIESTINPGVCDELIIPAIENLTDHKIGKTLYLAHCPERINPGDEKWHVGNIPRVLGANSQAALDIAFEFYSHIIDAPIKKMSCLKEAEACKVVENSFRDINIAFVNELAMSFDKLGINVNNVIDGAATKPFAFMAHYPGIGVGGHCIPVDPYYLIEYAKGRGFEHHFLSLARSINESMPIYAVDNLEKALISKSSKSLKNSVVLVLGLSYKPNVADDRESPSYKVIEVLESRGAKVKVYDPFYPDKSTNKNLEKAVQGSDAAILVTAHTKLIEFGANPYTGLSVFLDGRNALSESKNLFIENDILYIGI